MYVSSGTVFETTSEPETQKEPEPRDHHPESVETSILYRCTVLGAQQLSSNRRESCNFSMPDPLLSIEPSTEIPRTEVYKIWIFLLCTFIINNHQTIFSNFQPSFASFSLRKHTSSSSSAYQSYPSFPLTTLQSLQQAKQISSTCSVTLKSFTSLLSSPY